MTLSKKQSFAPVRTARTNQGEIRMEQHPAPTNALTFVIRLPKIPLDRTVAMGFAIKCRRERLITPTGRRPPSGRGPIEG